MIRITLQQTDIKWVSDLAEKHGGQAYFERSYAVVLLPKCCFNLAMEIAMYGD